MDKREAPWTDAEVESLNEYQRCRLGHPFTGGRKANGDETVLIATRDGWVEALGGLIVQTWAHARMADGSWRESLLYPFLSRTNEHHE